jgi:hypothetical protein
MIVLSRTKKKSADDSFIGGGGGGGGGVLRRTCGVKDLPAATRPYFEWFPYVCPEPVLVKWSFLYI